MVEYVFHWTLERTLMLIVDVAVAVAAVALSKRKKYAQPRNWERCNDNEME